MVDLMLAPISVSRVDFSWPGQHRSILKDVSFSLAAGEKCVLKGPSGIGKTTLLGALAGFNPPRSGKVELLGQDIYQLSDKKRDLFRADHIGFIFQMFNLIPYLSILDNIELSCRISKLRASRAAKRSGGVRREAERLMTHLSLDKDAIKNLPAHELSVGQQQRVAAARALMGSPEIIIADEPTSALDPDSQSAFIDLLLSECRRNNQTILFVSHDDGLEETFDRSLQFSKLSHLGGSQA